nr:MAG TPA: hypothetical protein [Caudoviricetes sp.]
MTTPTVIKDIYIFYPLTSILPYGRKFTYPAKNLTI